MTVFADMFDRVKLPLLSQLELKTLPGSHFNMVTHYCQYLRPSPLGWMAQAERWASVQIYLQHICTELCGVGMNPSVQN